MNVKIASIFWNDNIDAGEVFFFKGVKLSSLEMADALLDTIKVLDAKRNKYLDKSFLEVVK